MISAPAWEKVVETGTEATDRLAIPGGWLYRTVWHRASAGLGHPESQGSAVVFVPRSIFDLDHPYLAPEDKVSEPVPMQTSGSRIHLVPIQSSTIDIQWGGPPDAA